MAAHIQTHTHQPAYSFFTMNAQISIQPENTVHENIPGVNCGSCAVVLEPASNKHTLDTQICPIGLNLKWCGIEYVGLHNASVCNKYYKQHYKYITQEPRECRVNPQRPQVIFTVYTGWHEGPLVSPHMGLCCVCVLCVCPV